MVRGISRLLASLVVLCGSTLGFAQGDDRPLPDIPMLMHEVEAHQKAAEAIKKDYLYHSFETEQQEDGHGRVKKTETKESDVFWISGVPVWKLVKKDGRELTDEEKKKENERIDKEVAKDKARREKKQAEGKETDPMGHDEITVSRFLELGRFSNPRREMLDGRSTIAVDYAGDLKAKTRNKAEEVVRDLVGTIWVDEEDRTIRKLQGHFLNSFKIGGGLLVNIQKDTSFAMEQRKINEEVWLPSRVDAHGSARALLFFNFAGTVHVVDTDYRKFKATSRILPGVTSVSEPPPVAPSTSGPPK